MPMFKKDGDVNLLGNKVLVNDALKKLVKLNSADVVNYFDSINVTFPRRLRVELLRSLFRESVKKTREDRHTLADEMNYRLSWFNQYSEVQLVNLFKFYNDKKLEELYLEELWLVFLNDLINQNVKEHDIKNLLQLKPASKVKEDIIVFNNNLNELFYDIKGEIDGLTLDQIRPVLYKSSTITEIRELGKKYDVNVPVRLRKAELIDLITLELKERNEYTEEKEEELNKMNLILIQRYTKTHDIKVSTELKKEEVIEYILSNAKITKGSYYVPSANLYTELEEVKSKPVVKEEPAKETLVVKEEQVIVHQRVAQDRADFDFSNVLGKEINTLGFYGQNSKDLNKIMTNEIRANKNTIDPGVYEVTPKNEKDKNEISVFVKILVGLLLIMFIVIIFLFVYSLFTSTGVPQSLEGFENAITNITKIDFFKFLRGITSKIVR